MEILEVKIVQASAKAIIFRKCSRCLGKVVFVAVNDSDPGHDRFYCENCKVIVKEFSTSFKITLIVMDMFTQKLETAVAYNEAVEAMMGCTAAEFDKRLKQDPNLIRALENTLAGMSCTLEIFTGKKANRDGTKKCKNILFEPKGVKIIDLLSQLQQQQSSQFEPSLSMLA